MPPVLLQNLALSALLAPKRRDPETALRYANRAVDLTQRRQPGVLATLAMVLLDSEVGEPSRAVRVLEEATGLPDARPAHFEQLAEFRERVCPLLPSYASVEAVLTNGRSEIDGENDDPNVVDYIQARRLQLRENYADAAARFALIRERDPTAAEPLLRWAESLRKLGETDNSERLLLEGADSLQGADGWKPLDVWWAHRIHLSLDENVAELSRLESPSPGLVTDLEWLFERLAQTGVVRIACGSSEDLSGREGSWGRDRFHRGRGRAVDLAGRNVSRITDPLYTQYREFPGLVGGYRVPLPPGEYAVTLHFAAVEPRLQSSELRRFDIEIEGNVVRSRYSPSDAGFEIPDTVRSSAVSVRDGFLDLVLRRDPSLPAWESAVCVPAISGIEIEWSE